MASYVGRMVIKLSDYAKHYGVTYRTAWNRYKRGLIHGAYATDKGTILIPESSVVVSRTCENKCYIYCRVSSQKQKDDLQRQRIRVTEFANSNGYVVSKVFSEIASGVNDSRKELIKLLQDITWSVLIVENKDRLTRFGFNYIKQLCEVSGKRIIVMNEADDEKTDIVQDLVSIIYSFSAKIYGLRKAKHKQLQIVKILGNE